MSNRHRRLTQQQRQQKAVEKTAKKERKMPTQAVQLKVMAEVNLLFKAEVKKQLGENATFHQCAITSEGPFLKIIEVNGQVHLFHFDVILRADTIPATIAPASDMPPISDIHGKN